jgi:hypothetical protein
MLELGKFSQEEHASVGRTAARSVDELVLVGADVEATASAALDAGMPPEQVHLFPAQPSEANELACARMEAATYTRDHLHPGDLLLIKGSLGIGMDTIVTELQEKRAGHRLQTDITTRLQQLTQVETALVAGASSTIRLEKAEAEPEEQPTKPAPYSVDVGIQARSPQ